jgi:hypothetical protein
MAFPTDKTDAVNSTTTVDADHINALEDKVGIDSDTANSSHDYKLSNVTGTDKAASVTGTETLTNKTLTSPTINTPTVSSPSVTPIYAVFQVTTGATALTTGDGKFYLNIPLPLNGYNLDSVYARVVTAGTTGTTDIQVNNVTDAADMLSTVLTIDSGETGSDTAATPAVIDTGNDDVATNDLLRIDIDAVSSTAPQGLIMTLGFVNP